ncbi:MAG: cytochrome c [Armatimonadetes bacterium]|nr:cytochrome c [Armatimonadota bacterium]
MAEPQTNAKTNEPAKALSRGEIPRGLLVLFAILPLFALVYLMLGGGLFAPEIKPVARTFQGTTGVAGGGVADEPQRAEQVKAIMAVVPAEAHDDQPATPPGQADITAAATQYNALCAVCHGAKGEGDGAAGAALNPKPMNFHARAYQEQPKGVARWAIKNGLSGTARRSGMPAFALPDPQIWALVEYTYRLGK